jgi:hypothetical protein
MRRTASPLGCRGGCRGYRIIWRTLHITIGTTIACTASPKAPDERQTHRDGQSRIIGMIGVSAKPVAVKLTISMMLRRPAFILGSSWLNRLPNILATLAKPAKATESSAIVRGDREFRDRKENFSFAQAPHDVIVASFVIHLKNRRTNQKQPLAFQ